MIRQSSKQYFRGLGVVLGVLFLLPAPSQADLWCTAYYPGWTQSFLPASAVDFRAISHIVHFSLVPVANGSLDSSPNGVTLARSADVVSRAHAAGRKALICVGGADSGGGFRAATTAAHRATLISDLVNFMSARGYDGIDIDWEPLEASDAAQYSQFVTELRTAIDAITPRPLLTAAAASFLDTEIQDANV